MLDPRMRERPNKPLQQTKPAFTAFGAVFAAEPHCSADMECR
jgi:hypothetical protein